MKKKTDKKDVTYLRLRCTKTNDILIAERFLNICEDERYRYRDILLDLIDEWSRKKYTEKNGIEAADSFFNSHADMASSIDLDLS